MINLKNYKKMTAVIFICLFSMSASAVLGPMPEEQDNKPNQNSVLPPMGILNCEECVKAFAAGANSADIELTKWHEKQIFGSSNKSESAGSVD